MRDVATDVFASLLDALEVAHADDPVEAAVRRSGFAELSGEPPARSPGVIAIRSIIGSERTDLRVGSAARGAR